MEVEEDESLSRVRGGHLQLLIDQGARLINRQFALIALGVRAPQGRLAELRDVTRLIAVDAFGARCRACDGAPGSLGIDVLLEPPAPVLQLLQVLESVEHRG